MQPLSTFRRITLLLQAQILISRRHANLSKFCMTTGCSCVKCFQIRSRKCFRERHGAGARAEPSISVVTVLQIHVPIGCRHSYRSNRPGAMPTIVDLPEVAHWLQECKQRDLAESCKVHLWSRSQTWLCDKRGATGWKAAAIDDNGTLIAVRLPAASLSSRISYPFYGA